MTLPSLRRIPFRGLSLGLLALLLTAVGLWQLSKMRSYQIAGRLVHHGSRTDSIVALTFDDGPTPAYTDSILAALRSRGIRATFFVTGRELEANPEEGDRLVRAGHELGNHSYSHPSLVLVTPRRVERETERTDEAIRRAGHEGPIYFRPPFGKKLFVLPWYLARTGRTTVTWDVEPESYPSVRDDPRRIAEHVIERVQPGSIVLLHVMYRSRRASRRAVPLIIDGLKARGYRFVPVGELLGRR